MGKVLGIDGGGSRTRAALARFEKLPLSATRSDSIRSGKRKLFVFLNAESFTLP